MIRILKRTFMLSLVLFMVGATAFIVSANGSLKDAKNKREELKNKQKQAQKEINDLKDARDSTVDYIDKLDSQLSKILDRILELNQDLDNKAREIEIALEELEIAKADEQTHYDLTKERIKFMYEKGNDAYIDVLLKSKNISELLNRMDYVQKISEYDKNLLITLQSIKDDIIQKEEILQEEYSLLEVMNEEMAMEKESLEGVIAIKNEEIQKYEDNIEEREAKLKAFEDDLKKQEAEIKKLEAAQSKLKYDGGKFAWPVPGVYRVTSEFGYRFHPIYKVNKLHNGLDIGAATGTKIVAAYTGTVVIATYSSTAGNYITIDHGDGYYTTYMHCSKLLVSVGQKVTRGESIALVGNTGLSTGAHLHFGVRKGGEWINPRQFIGSN